MSEKRSFGPRGTGIGVGVAIGVAIGVALDNIALGIGVGVALGAAIEVTSRRPGSKDEDQDGGGDDA